MSPGGCLQRGGILLGKDTFFSFEFVLMIRVLCLKSKSGGVTRESAQDTGGNRALPPATQKYMAAGGGCHACCCFLKGGNDAAEGNDPDIVGQLLEEIEKL